MLPVPPLDDRPVLPPNEPPAIEAPPEKLPPPLNDDPLEPENDPPENDPPEKLPPENEPPLNDDPLEPENDPPEKEEPPLLPLNEEPPDDPPDDPPDEPLGRLDPCAFAETAKTRKDSPIAPKLALRTIHRNRRDRMMHLFRKNGSGRPPICLSGIIADIFTFRKGTRKQ